MMWTWVQSILAKTVASTEPDASISVWLANRTSREEPVPAAVATRCRENSTGALIGITSAPGRQPCFGAYFING